MTKSRHDKVLIFVKTKKGCDRLAKTLEYDGYKAVAIHGDKAQNARDYIISQFKKGYKNILVATDVASRGLDIKDIKFVINYDFPMTIEDYIHRIGRTGRAGTKGDSFTFLTHDDAGFAKDLVELLKKSKQPVSRELEDLSRRSHYKKKKRYNNYGGGGYRKKDNWWGNKNSGGGNRGYNNNYNKRDSRSPRRNDGGWNGASNNRSRGGFNSYSGGRGGGFGGDKRPITSNAFRYEDR